MRIVLDSNVIIAAFATKGLCSEIFEACILEHEIILSKYIIEEVERHFVKKLKMPLEKVKERIKFIKGVSDSVSPAHVDESLCRDKSDLPIIGTAISGNAEVIVSGDPDLTDIGKYQNIKFLKPREFWDLLRSK